MGHFYIYSMHAERQSRCVLGFKLTKQPFAFSNTWHLAVRTSADSAWQASTMQKRACYTSCQVHVCSGCVPAAPMSVVATCKASLPTVPHRVNAFGAHGYMVTPQHCRDSRRGGPYWPCASITAVTVRFLSLTQPLGAWHRHLNSCTSKPRC